MDTTGSRRQTGGEPVKMPRFRPGQYRGLPLHLDTDASDFQPQYPMEGEVTAVYPKDHPQNLTGGKYTTYQVTVFYPNTYTAVLNSQMRAMGQGVNGANAQEDPLLVGQRVAVNFFSGDPDRPFIMGVLPDSFIDNNVSQTQAEFPRYRKDLNGVETTVSKDGAASIKLVSGQQVEIQDSNGNVLLVVKENGTIQLGGTTGLDKLLQRDFVAALKGLFAATVIVPGDGGAAIKTALTTGLNNTLADANSTTQTEAK